MDRRHDTVGADCLGQLSPDLYRISSVVSGWDPGRAYITDSGSEAPTAIHTAVMNMNPCITIPGDAADSQPILRLGSSANHSFESCTVNETIHGGLGIDSVCYSAIRSDFHF